MDVLAVFVSVRVTVREGFPENEVGPVGENETPAGNPVILSVKLLGVPALLVTVTLYVALPAALA
jgi:hypothetical protein